MNDFIPLMVIIPLTCALLLNLFHKKDKIIIIIAIIIAVVIPIIPLLSNYGLHYFGGHPPFISNSTLLSYIPAAIHDPQLAFLHPAITYSYDALQKLFIFILGIIGFFSVFTSLHQNKNVSGPFMFLIFMGIASVIALLLSDDIFHLYVFFEIVALTQTGIILSSKTDQSYETALKYMILSSIGGPLILLGIGFILGVVGSVNITDIVYAISHNLVNPLSPSLLFAFALLFFGWLYASGLPPFHTIKSAVYSKALPNAAAILQAFTVIIFVSIVIILFRIFSYFPFFETLIIIFSLAAMILGVTMAIMQTDFRRMIAFLAVGELGYIGLGFGLATQFSITAGLFQAVNEIIISALLFFGFGTILYLTKTSDIKKLGGMIEHNPFVAIMILIGGFALAGVPPLNGFQSKLMIIQASLNAGFPEISIIAILVSIAIFMVFIKAFHSIYLKPKPNDLKVSDKSVPISSIIAIFVLLILCIVLGLFPNLATDTISQFAMGLI